MGTPSLQRLLDQSVERHPDRVAVVDPGEGELTYRELGRLSDLTRDRLVALGVRPGDRVGVYLPKSIDAVAAIFGILKAGAAYVPVDPGSPPWRAAFILNNCSVRTAVVLRQFESALLEETAKLGGTLSPLVLETAGGGRGLSAVLDDLNRTAPAPEATTVPGQPDDLAYILYTSGSTGKPKGVMLSQLAGTSYVDWCSIIFEPVAEDVFSSHAPFHFDLSILDLYLPLKHGAKLVLIGEDLGKDPLSLAQLIAEQRISVWYSTPSILSLLAQYGKLERHDLGALRHVLFAGEVFPVPQLRVVKQLIPRPRYFNLYGPTETNVCTYYELPSAIEPDRTEPYPIGRTCENLESRVVDLDDQVVPPGQEGELLITGPNVMSGYWNLPEQNARAFLTDPDGTRWYHTGDLVLEQPPGNYIFHGRRDRMVKRRGYRVELGEIEAGLATHPAVREVAVVAVPDKDSGVRIKAFLSINGDTRPSLIQFKQFCMDRLPKYMAPDLFGFVDALPRTSTDKIDYQTLKTMV